ncbi:MAG: LysM peptidoglycan-binding domain-containing protein [Candidatus Cloacimonetes bacterium]|nr:LysM peptidoglycan-binding domain-containing protein [Candidatus Cloacimonadota bacterium]
MKKYIALFVLIMILASFLQAEVRYLTEEEYKDLSKEETLKYWEALENEMMMLQVRQANTCPQVAENELKIADLKEEIALLDQQYNVIYTRIMNSIGTVSHSDLINFEQQLNEIKNKLDYYDQLPNSELYKSNQEIKNFIAQYEDLKGENLAKVPQFQQDFAEIDSRIEMLQENMYPYGEYYEDEYTVVKGDYLVKIAGYEHIYNDPQKWGIIYRANRDQIKDPDLIYPNQVFKIPRGLPSSWKVYKGECLWTISSYPEIYNDPFQWPKIYRANTDQIKDPDLIYPNQILRIPRD